MKLSPPRVALRDRPIDSITVQIKRGAKTVFLMVYPKHPMNNLFRLVGHAMGYPLEDFRLFCEGQLLVDSGAIESSGLEDGDIIHFCPKEYIENAKIVTFEQPYVIPLSNDPNYRVPEEVVHVEPTAEE